MVAFEGIRRRPFHKRLVPSGELENVHLPLDGPDQAQRGALDARAISGVMLGYGDVSQSYLVWMPHIKQVRLMRSITLLPFSQRWRADAWKAVDVTKKDLHAGRGAQAVPFARRHRDAAQTEV